MTGRSNADKNAAEGKRLFPPTGVKAQSGAKPANPPTRPSSTGAGTAKSPRPRHGNRAQPALLPIGTRPPFTVYLRRLWKYRSFIFYQSRLKAFAAARNTVLGNLWLVINPLLSATVYILIFGFLLQTSRGVENFIAFVVVGACFFPFMSTSLSKSGTLISGNKNLIKSFSFPRATLVLSDFTRRLFDLIPVVLTTLVALMVIPERVFPTWTWVLMIPALILMFMFCAGLSLAIAKLGTIVADVRHVLSFVSRMWFYASGIFYPIERFAAFPTLYEIMTWNPAAVYLILLRDVIIYDSFSTLEVWTRGVIWAVAMLSFGLVTFWRSEEHYGKF